VNLVKARAINPQSTVAVWAPSSPAPALFPRRFGRALRALRSHGYTVEIGASCEGHIGYAALPPEQLAYEFHSMLEDPNIDAVFCAVGGSTVFPLLPYIDWSLVRARRKLIVGFSDISVLLWAQLTCAGLTSLHGPTVISDWGEIDGIARFTADEFDAVAAGSAPRILTPPATTTDEVLWWDRHDDRPRKHASARPWSTIAPGSAEGALLPGCLTSISRLFGTRYMPDVNGAIVCLEALDMAPDEFWTLLSQWRISGELEKVSGLVIGRPARPKPSATGFADHHWAIREVAGDLGIPVLADVDFGHTDPRLTLPVGTRARLDAAAGTLVLLEPAVCG
jgi:muramoyltetrapeptide carboxypeptidase